MRIKRHDSKNFDVFLQKRVLSIDFYEVVKHLYNQVFLSLQKLHQSLNYTFSVGTLIFLEIYQMLDKLDGFYFTARFFQSSYLSP